MSDLQNSELPQEENQSSTPPKRVSNVVIYLTALFAAAFLMLLMAYFMQQRTNEVTIGNLTQSITSIDSLNQLIDENQELHDELDALERELDMANAKLDSAKQQYDMLNNGYQDLVVYENLLNTLYQANQLAEEGDVEGIRALLEPWDNFEEALAQYDAKRIQDGQEPLTDDYQALLELLEED